MIDDKFPDRSDLKRARLALRKKNARNKREEDSKPMSKKRFHLRDGYRRTLDTNPSEFDLVLSNWSCRVPTMVHFQGVKNGDGRKGGRKNADDRLSSWGV